MSTAEVEIYAIAYDVERAMAADRVRSGPRGLKCRGRNARELRRQHIAAEMDPLAMVNLAEMIERRLSPWLAPDGAERVHARPLSAASSDPETASRATQQGESA